MRFKYVRSSAAPCITSVLFEAVYQFRVAASMNGFEKLKPISLAFYSRLLNSSIYLIGGPQKIHVLSDFFGVRPQCAPR
jgi:hypothetical protein